MREREREGEKRAKPGHIGTKADSSRFTRSLSRSLSSRASLLSLVSLSLSPSLSTGCYNRALICSVNPAHRQCNCELPLSDEEAGILATACQTHLVQLRVSLFSPLPLFSSRFSSLSPCLRSLSGVSHFTWCALSSEPSFQALLPGCLQQTGSWPAYLHPHPVTHMSLRKVFAPHSLIDCASENAKCTKCTLLPVYTVPAVLSSGLFVKITSLECLSLPLYPLVILATAETQKERLSVLSLTQLLLSQSRSVWP